MVTETPLAFCILNGYPKPSRDNFDLAGVGHPHDFFIDFLGRYVPGAAVDVVFIADADVGLPFGTGLSAYDGFIWTGSDLLDDLCPHGGLFHSGDGAHLHRSPARGILHH